jgi:hypothetical protein
VCVSSGSARASCGRSESGDGVCAQVCGAEACARARGSNRGGGGADPATLHPQSNLPPSTLWQARAELGLHAAPARTAWVVPPWTAQAN